MSQFGKNLKHLRKMAGETQKQLAKALHCTDSAISKLESGKISPSRDQLEAISRRYCKTVDQLLYADLTNIQPFSFETDGLKEIVSASKHIFPLINSDTAQLNRSFSIAYKKCTEIIDAASANRSISTASLVRCGELFDLAAEDDQCRYEASANQLWVILQMWGALIISGEAQEELSEAVYKRENRQSFFQALLEVRTVITSKEVEEKQSSFIALFSEKYLELIRVLKSDNSWSALGDYYLALRFFFGMIDNGESAAFNTQIGMQLLKALVSLGNEYAYNTLKACFDL